MTDDQRHAIEALCDQHEAEVVGLYGPSERGGSVVVLFWAPHAPRDGLPTLPVRVGLCPVYEITPDGTTERLNPDPWLEQLRERSDF
jgi:hypothetical protein